MSEIKSKAKKPKHAQRKPNSTNKNPIFALLISLVAGTAAFFASAFFITFLLEKSADPCSLLDAASIVCTVMAAGTAGAVSSRLTRRPAPWSIVSGLGMILVYLVLSVIFNDTKAGDNSMVFKTVTVALLPVIAFVSGKLFAKKREHTHIGR